MTIKEIPTPPDGAPVAGDDKVVGEIATPPDGAPVAGDDKVVGEIATSTDRAPVAGDDSRLSFDVREVFNDLPILNPVKVNAALICSRPRGVDPITTPEGYTTQAKAFGRFDLEVGIGVTVEENTPVLSNGILPLADCPTGRRRGSIKHTILADQAEHTREVMLVKGLSKSNDGANAGLSSIHMEWGHLEVISY
jgi:hypothetical protein